jgi:large subunit ribosomal protein L25
MERVSLTAVKRVPHKGEVNRMRGEGRIPAVLYGKSVKPLSISIERKALEKATKTSAGMNVMIDLTVEGGDSGLAFIRDYQADPFKRNFLHVDFQAIRLDEPIEIEVPIVITGESHGVKEGGVLVQQRHTLHIKAKPNDIPDSITIDITELGINDSVHADDIALPQGAEFPHTANYSVVAVVPPTKEEEVAPVPVEGELAEGEAAEGEAAEGAAAEGAAAAEGEKEGGEGKQAKQAKQAKKE